MRSKSSPRSVAKMFRVSLLKDLCFVLEVSAFHSKFNEHIANQ